MILYHRTKSNTPFKLRFPNNEAYDSVGQRVGIKLLPSGTSQVQIRPLPVTFCQYLSPHTVSIYSLIRSVFPRLQWRGQNMD